MKLVAIGSVSYYMLTAGGVLTRMPSQRDTARNGRNALSVRIERNAGISAAPTKIAPKFINDNYKHNRSGVFFFFICHFCFCFSYARIFVRCVCEIRRKDVSFILRSLQFLAISSGSRKLLYTHNSLFVLFIDRPVCRHLSS